MEKKRKHVVISGFVQGVCFRYETCYQAKAQGVVGWVMNRSDGKVEAVFEGDNGAVANMVSWSHNGPAGAVVDKVTVKDEEYKGEFKDFDIKYY